MVDFIFSFLLFLRAVWLVYGDLFASIRTFVGFDAFSSLEFLKFFCN